MSSRARKPVHATAVRGRRGFTSRLVAATALLVGVLSACTESLLPPLPATERDEAGVYTAVLREYARILSRLTHPERHQYLLVGDHISWSSEFEPGAELPPGFEPNVDAPEWLTRLFFTMRQDCLDDYAQQGPVPRPLPEIELDFPLRWQPRLSEAERETFFWDGFDAEHGGKAYLTQLSPIGFDATGTQALVEVVFSKGWLDAFCELLFLERGPLGWRVVGRFTYWVS